MRWIDALRASWNGRPLVFRLVGLIVVLFTLGFLLSSTVMVGLLQRHLLAQIDTQLITSAQTLAEQTAMPSPEGENIPTPYFIRRVVVGEEDELTYYHNTVAVAGFPQIPELLRVGEVAATPSGSLWTQPVTVNSTKKGATWRAMAVPLASGDTPVGVMTIALPLTDVQHTLQTVSTYFLIVSVAIITTSGYLGHYLVRRSLKALQNIESTAGKIAAGDLTQRVKPEPPTTEVGSLALSLNTMLSQVEQSFEARQRSEQKIRRFVSDASHELRTPLAAIRGYAELYSMGGVPTDHTDEVMGRIQSEATRMGVLVEDLLTLARLDENRPLSISDIDLVKMADNASFDLQALDPTRPVAVLHLNGKNAPMTLVVPADRDRIQQVFTNLVGNIVRYTPEGSPVELALGIVDNMAIVEFRDHGPGIDVQDQERVFERFYRAENSRSRSLGGSGLGLAIVSGIMSAHHGQATLSRTKDGGLTVRLSLPLRRPTPSE